MQGIKAVFEEATKLATNPVKVALLVLLKGRISKDRMTPDAKKVTLRPDPVCAVCCPCSVQVFVYIVAGVHQLWEVHPGSTADMLHTAKLIWSGAATASPGKGWKLLLCK